MLPRWRDEARILLSPRGAELRLVPRSLRPAARVKVHSCAAGAAGETWRAPLAALGEAMRELPRRARCRVIASSAFARYALVPFSAALVDRKANEALAAHLFRHVYGEAAQGWTCRVAPAPAGHNRMACALDTALVAGIESAARSCGMTLAAIEPAFTAGFNFARRRLPRSCWFAAAEAGKLVLGLLVEGEWTHLAAERSSGDWEPALARMLARESLTAAAEPGDEPRPCWIARFDPGTDPACPEIRLFEAAGRKAPPRCETAPAGERAAA